MNNAVSVSSLDEMKPMVDRLLWDSIGAGGRVYWNPDTKASFAETDYKKSNMQKQR